MKKRQARKILKQMWLHGRYGSRTTSRWKESTIATSHVIAFRGNYAMVTATGRFVPR